MDKTTTAPTPDPVVKEETALQAPDTSTKEMATFDFGEHVGLGVADLSTRLIKIPFLVLLQPNTRGVTDPQSPVFGKAGLLWNPLTNEFHRVLLSAILKIEEEYIEREPQKAGGSVFVAKHKPGSEFVRASFKRTEAARAQGLDKASEEGRKRYGFGKLVAPTGNNIVVETYAALGAWRDMETGSTFGAIFGFKSAGIPAVAGWTTGLRNNRELPNGVTVKPGQIPLAANRVKLLAEYREKPNAHFAAVLRPVCGNIRDSIMQDDLYQIAIDNWTMLKDGRAQIDEDTREVGEKVGDDDTGNGDPKMVF